MTTKKKTAWYGVRTLYRVCAEGAPKKRDHVIPKDLQPTVFMMCYPLSSPSRAIWPPVKSRARMLCFGVSGFGPPLNEVPISG